MKDIVGDNYGAGKGMQDGDVILLPEGDVYIHGDKGDPCSVYNTTLLGHPNGTTVHVLGGSYRTLRVYQRTASKVLGGNVVNANFCNLKFDGSNITDNSSHFIYTTAYNAVIGMKDVVVENYKGHLFSIWGAENLTDGDNTTEYSQYPYPTKADNLGVDIYLRNVDTTNVQNVIDFDLMPYTGGGTGNQAGWSYAALNYKDDCTFGGATLYTFRAGRAQGQGNAFINGVLVDEAKPVQ